MDLIEGIKTLQYLLAVIIGAIHELWEMDLIEGIKTGLLPPPLRRDGDQSYEKWTW